MSGRIYEMKYLDIIDIDEKYNEVRFLYYSDLDSNIMEFTISMEVFETRYLMQIINEQYQMIRTCDVNFKIIVENRKPFYINNVKTKDNNMYDRQAVADLIESSILFNMNMKEKIEEYRDLKSIENVRKVLEQI